MSGPAEYTATDIASRAPGNVAFIDLLHQRMDAKGGHGSLADLFLLLERDNRFIPTTTSPRRTTPAEKSRFALIRCDGGGMLGYGHVKRSLTLAKSLRDREGFTVVFALNGEPEAAALLKGAGFETITLPRIGQTNAFVALVADRRPDILIVDAGTNVSRDMLTRISTQVGILALIGDASDRRLAATHAYYPVTSQSRGASWGNAQTKVHAGFEWALLGFDPALVSAPAALRDADRPNILVSMGGSDPLELTRLVARALAKVAAPFRARFVIGPGFRGSQGLVRDIEALNPAFETVQGLQDLGKEFAAADLALLSFGVIAYEAAALGVPALYLALSDDERFMGESFEAAGMGTVLGLSRELRSDDIVRPILELLQDKQRRSEMSAAGLAAIDGKGGDRIAADLAHALAEQRKSNRPVLTHTAVSSAS